MLKIKCTGKIATDGSKLITGIGTKFLLELRHKDHVLIGDTEVIVKAIVDNYCIVCDTLLPTVSNIDLYIVKANIKELLTMPIIDYTRIESVFNQGYWLPNIDQYSTTVLFAGQVLGQAPVSIDFKLVESNKAAILPNEFIYTIPCSARVPMDVTEGSTVLTVHTTDFRVATTAGSNIVRYRSGSKLFIQNGVNITIDNIDYTIVSIYRDQYNSYVDVWFDYAITLDKPVNSTFSTAPVSFCSDVANLFAAGCMVLVNGKLYKVTKAIGNTIQVKFPISATDTIMVKRPLMANQYGINSIQLYNAPYPEELLIPGNVLVIQDFRSEDDLYAAHTCYTEAKHIARLFDDGHIVCMEPNKTAFSGLACIGVKSNGWRALPTRVVGNITGFYLDDVNGSLPYEILNSYVKLNNALYKVTGINGRFATTIPNTEYKAYTCQFVPDIGAEPTYTTLVNNLALLLAGKIIKYSFSFISDITSMYKEFLSTWNFSCDRFAQRQTVYSVYEPDYFAVNKYSAPPVQLEQNTSVVENTSPRSFQYSNIVYRCCGLPITSPKG